MSGPVGIITGAANGIGRAMALTFAEKGYRLVLVDVDATALHELKKVLAPYEDNMIVLEGDLGNTDFLNSIMDAGYQKWSRIDVLINNAAWRTIETMRNISLENWNHTLSVCLTAPAFLAKNAAALMEKNGNPGVIINISSVMSQRAAGTSPAYIACKGAMESLTYELAALYGPKDIRIITVSPGNIQTSMSMDYTDQDGNNISAVMTEEMNDQTPLKRAGKEQEIADVCYWLTTKEASFISGTTIAVDGGFSHNFNSYTLKKKQFPHEF